MNYEMSCYSSFDAYVKSVFEIPLLSEQEEFDLVNKFREENCIESIHKVVISHLQYVVSIAYRYTRFGFPIQDLVQEGNVGLMIAAKKFDTTYKIRFSQYSKFWIKSYIQQYILDNWSLVKIATTDLKKKLFYNLEKIKQKLYTLTGEVDYHILSKELNTPVELIEEMDSRQNEMIYDNYDDSDSVIDQLSSSKLLPDVMMIRHEEQDKVLNKLKNVVSSFNERDQFIVYNRMMTDDKMTFEQLSEKFGISRERVRQLEEKIFKNIKKAMTQK